MPIKAFILVVLNYLSAYDNILLQGFKTRYKAFMYVEYFQS